MKTGKKELDVDFIGGEGKLTTEEELAISQFIRSQKLKQNASKKAKSVAGQTKNSI